MQEFIIRDKKLLEIPIIEGFPDSYLESYGIPDSIKYHAFYGRLPMLFQMNKIGPYEIALSHYLTNESEKLTTTANDPCVEIHFMLAGRADFKVRGHSWKGMEAGQYNMIALTNVKNEVFFKATPILTLDTHIPIKRLRELVKLYPQLKPLLEALNNHGHQSLFANPLWISIEMMKIIYLIKEALYAGKASSQETLQMVEQLIIIAVTNKPKRTKYNYSYDHVSTLYESKRLLAQYLDEKDILSRKIKESNIKPDKFREGFKSLFNTLPSTFLKDKRMQLAKKLAEDANATTIREIATLCGYNSAKHLSKAFYDYFGVKLSEILKDSRKSRKF